MDMKQFHIITLFKESFTSYIDSSIIGRAVSEKHIKINYYNPRDYVKPTKTQSLKDNPLRVVDDKPYGGGVGMVIKAEPVLKALDVIYKKFKARKFYADKDTAIIFFTPSGDMFDTDTAKNLSTYKDIIMICGRYEGVDARVREIYKTIDISIGNYVLTGGELPALILIDSISRQIPGVLGKIESLEESRFASDKVYTRPSSFDYKGKTYTVPNVLLKGNHAEIEKWRKDN